MPVRSEAKVSRPRSPSVELLKSSLDDAGVNRKTFVKETGLSYEYVSRIFNSKVKFPTVRETLERFAEVAQIDPMRFAEYQSLVDALPESTRQIWTRMQEKGISRQDFANRVEISRTYLYEILRGDVPFPRNPEVIEKIATAIELPPETFAEYLAPVEDWALRNPAAIEQVFFNILVGKFLLERGYRKAEANEPSLKISEDLLVNFPPEDGYEAVIKKVFTAIGKKGLSFQKLAQESNVSSDELRALFLAKIKPEDAPETIKALKTTLKIR
jgi:transcriptional regulator with XRE-family HTH domain